MFDHQDDNPLVRQPAVPEPAAEAVVPPAAEAIVPPAVERFNTCRWRSQEQGRYCTHRDVLPLAGREGFNPEAWCPDCSFFKVRRVAKKREFGY
jgi:hypothetical protein